MLNILNLAERDILSVVSTVSMLWKVGRSSSAVSSVDRALFQESEALLFGLTRELHLSVDCSSAEAVWAW